MRTQAAYWRILILDPTGMMVDIPEADVESVDFEDIVNGGSGTGTLVLRRDIYNAGAIDHDYTVMIFMWDAHYSQPLPPQSIPPPPPVDPYYVGHVVDIDQEELITHGRITFSIEGDATMLADGIVTESINPGAAYGNPDLPAQDYLLHVITTYQDASLFLAPFLPASMFNLTAAQWDAKELSGVIDDVVKQGRDISGLLYTWRVDYGYHLGNPAGAPQTTLTRRIHVMKDQNPNVDPTIPLVGLIRHADFTEYKISTKYRDIKNVAAAYGGRDPVSGAQIYGVYDDPVSVGEYRAKETKITNNYILDMTTLQDWAESWFDVHAYPQAQIGMRLLAPRLYIRAGTWVRILEYPTPDDVTTGATMIVKDERVSTVHVTIKDDRIDMDLTTVSPTPYLDQAIYKIGLHANTVAQQVASHGPPPNHNRTFIRLGGVITAKTAGPPTITLNDCQAVFVDALVSIPGATLALAGGDGQFYIVVTAGGTYSALGPLKKAPNYDPTRQVVAECTVIGGVVFQ
jgi:hypothetical protein